jgi:hypothetical protein
MTRKSETVSKTRMLGKRGRPPAFPIGEDVAVSSVWGGLITTKRSIRNKQYAAVGATRHHPL